MHRQSLGSPASKLHSHGAKEDSLLNLQDLKRKVQVSSLLINAEDEEESKSEKLHNSPWRPERFIHFIPILTLLCFLILYISSHNPSQQDLAQFNGFNLSSKPIKSNEIGRFLEIEKGNVMEIRSLRNLKESNTISPRYRPHRKIGDF
ncbi:hypothetical protein LguiB_034426 [Lonicera macranthoides]